MTLKSKINKQVYIDINKQKLYTRVTYNTKKKFNKLDFTQKLIIYYCSINKYMYIVIIKK